MIVFSNFIMSNSKNTQTFEEFKKEVEDPEKQTDLLPGTRGLYKAALSSNNLIGLCLKGVYIFIALNNTLSQFVIAFKDITSLPFFSIIIFVKELFGFIIYFLPAIKALKERPKNTFDCLIDPFSEGGLFSKLQVSDQVKPYLLKITTFCYVLGSLSNLRSALGLAISLRWNTLLPLLSQESELQKIGNFLILSIDLVIKTKNEDKIINVWLFISMLKALLFLILGNVDVATNSIQIYHWLYDIRDGKVDKNGIALGMSGLYMKFLGEKPDNSFLSSFGVTEENKPDEGKEKTD